MELLGQTKPGHLEQVDLLATIVFLGALCCAVVGIKLKWFKAQLTFPNPGSNSSSTDSRAGVYTFDEPGIYAPSFRVIDETEYDKPTTTQISRPVLQSSTLNTNPQPTNNKSNKDSSKNRTELNNGIDGQNSSQTDKNKLSTKKNDRDKSNQREKGESSKQTNEKTKTEKDVKSKSKKKDEKTKKDDKAKKDEKPKKVKKSDKSKKEKEKKDEKVKKQKDKTPVVVGNTTNETSVTGSTQNNLKNPTSSTTMVKPKEISEQSGQQTRNPRNKIQNSQPQVDTGFSSSWDMVAAHRQNLQREVASPAKNNLRSMANQNVGTTSVSTSKTNNGFIGSKGISSEDSDTEA